MVAFVTTCKYDAVGGAQSGNVSVRMHRNSLRLSTRTKNCAVASLKRYVINVVKFLHMYPYIPYECKPALCTAFRESNGCFEHALPTSKVCAVKSSNVLAGPDCKLWTIVPFNVLCVSLQHAMCHPLPATVCMHAMEMRTRNFNFCLYFHFDSHRPI